MDMKTWTARRSFLAEAEQLLTDLAEQKGLTVEIGQRTDGSQIWCILKQDEQDVRSEFELASRKFRFPVEWWQKEFVQKNELFRIVGAKLSAEKNCLRILRVKDEKEFVCSPYFVDPLVHMKKAG